MVDSKGAASRLEMSRSLQRWAMQLHAQCQRGAPAQVRIHADFAEARARCAQSSVTDLECRATISRCARCAL
jgi:hypothetical protein